MGRAGHRGGRGASSPAFLGSCCLCPLSGGNGAGMGREAGRRLSMQGKVSWLRCHSVHEGLGQTFPPSSPDLSFSIEFEKGIGSERSFRDQCCHMFTSQVGRMFRCREECISLSFVLTRALSLVSTGRRYLCSSHLSTTNLERNLPREVTEQGQRYTASSQ